jgi:predicted RNase H-like nuclease (RuvC/YqgF family)
MILRYKGNLYKRTTINARSFRTVLDIDDVITNKDTEIESLTHSGAILATARLELQAKIEQLKEHLESEIKNQAAEIERLKEKVIDDNKEIHQLARLLGEALPYISCDTANQSGLITAIGIKIQALKGGKE